jgi:hypothetical protein
MKTINIDDFLNENAVEVTIKGKPYKIKDMTIEDANELGKEDANKKEVLAKIIGCKEEELNDYGAIALFGIVRFLNENLLPKVSQ